MVLEQQGCQQCHPVRGQGLGHEPPQVARDLGERLAPTYGPHTLASALWNHTPAMSAQFSAQGVMPPAASESDWQDLFAYFYSLQFAEPPAEAGRGKRVLESKRCTECHSLTKTPTARGPSIPDWAHMDDPVVLLYQMWNHASSMKRTFASAKIEWKTLNGLIWWISPRMSKTSRDWPRHASSRCPRPKTASPCSMRTAGYATGIPIHWR